MIIAIDIQSSVTQRAGIGRYTRELALNLSQLISNQDQLRLVYFDFKRQAIPVEVKDAHLNPVRWIPGRAAQYCWKKFHAPSYHRLAGNADVYHFPNFIIPPLTQGVPVVSIHDLSFMRYPQFAETRNVQYLNQHIQETAKRAEAIITISQHSANDISTFLQVPPERIHVTYPGIDKAFHRPSDEAITAFKKKHALDKPYLLAVGTLEPRKNLQHLIRLFEQLETFDGDLVLAGGGGWKEGSLIRQIQESPCKTRIRMPGFIPDDDLPALYAGATALIMPSFYEGFGFPPLEAMACGTPVLSSSGGSLREICSDAAICLDHYDLDGWKAAAISLIEDNHIREDLIQKGFKRAQEFSWETTARQTLDVYRKVAS